MRGLVKVPPRKPASSYVSSGEAFKALTLTGLARYVGGNCWFRRSNILQKDKIRLPFPADFASGLVEALSTEC
jgi:hypothetical protein